MENIFIICFTDVVGGSSDTALIIALIGSGTAFLGIIVTTLFGFLTWSRNIKFQILKDERDRFEEKAQIVLEHYHEALNTGKLDVKYVAVILYEFPSEVSKIFRSSMEADVLNAKDIETKQAEYMKLALAMSKSIDNYSQQIKKTAEVVDKKFAMELAMDIVKKTISLQY
ncbi:hypothetical protein Enr10x_07780 [Gimesia panareensis]|uniref:Uncharacterized protein n=1 Tax=Gimesia panareensis TaxID=2527978 RepID=A0A517Q1N6_9PLAN|nr:hypothetical protein [Gimesia panareensis]QDT25482.1 hypothetical protein Enr10x_07780 [Gimesia panareensis]